MLSSSLRAARECYHANHPGVEVDPRDVREIEAADILERTGLAVGELDVLEGSPPCSAFSTSGKREADWGKEKHYSGKKQRVDDLFFEFVRLAKGLQPKVLVAENVPGLISGTARGYFKEIHSALQEAGYNVVAGILKAEQYGVP